jgi:hypothetical protein
MKLKLDENFGRRCIDILSDASHDVASYKHFTARRLKIHCTWARIDPVLYGFT